MLQTPHNPETAPLDYLETWALDQDAATRALVDRFAKAERNLAAWDTDLPNDLIDTTPAAVARRLDELETEVSQLESELEDVEEEANTLRDQLREKETA